MIIYHIPVMPKEVIHYLNIQPDSWYLDCTLGGGGHTERILKMGGKVLGIDLDQEAIDEVSKKYRSENLILVNNNFSHVQQIVRQYQIKPAGILFDLGVSSHQLETPERGFSFSLDAPLDMRMDPINQQVSAKDLIEGLHEGELSDLFWKLGEERFAKRIAKKIVEERAKRRIETTNQLAQIILSVRKRTAYDRTHPATKVFQALRIAVNDELNSLREALPKALEVLEKGGRLVVISFHSLEDRIVKNYFKDLEQHPQSHPELDSGSIKILTKKPLTPTEDEIATNPRARSGKLRAVEKI